MKSTIVNSMSVGLINIATKTPAPVPLRRGFLLYHQRNTVELELELWLQYFMSPMYISVHSVELKHGLLTSPQQTNKQVGTCMLYYLQNLGRSN